MSLVRRPIESFTFFSTTSWKLVMKKLNSKGSPLKTSKSISGALCTQVEFDYGMQSLLNAMYITSVLTMAYGFY